LKKAVYKLNEKNRDKLVEKVKDETINTGGEAPNYSQVIEATGTLLF